MAKDYTMDDPEFYTLLAKTIGTDTGLEIEDDSDVLDENGVVIAADAPEKDAPAEEPQTK